MNKAERFKIDLNKFAKITCGHVLYNASSYL